MSECHDSTGLNRCTTYTYDRLGRQETVTDAEGTVRRTLYNGLGLPVQETEDDGGLAATVTYRYNDLLDLVQAIDTNGNSTWYTYTVRGEVQTETYADSTTVGYTYDPRGNVDTMTLQDGAWIEYTYDAANRRNRADFSTGGAQTFAFDDAGRLTQATQAMDGHTTVTGYSYNGVGDVVSTTQQLDAGTAWQTTYVYSYTLGERQVVYPSGAKRTYQFDAVNRLDAVKRGDETLADYAYDVASRFNTVAYDNGLTNRVDYNPLGWITRTQVYSAGAGTLGVLVNYSYGYDLVGNRTYMQRHHKTNQPADVYRYDGMYQLVDVWYGADATTPASITDYDRYQSYDLDTLGNRLVVENDGAGQSYGPQSGGQLTNPMNRYETVDADTLSYDARGNTLDDGINTYAYDVLNRQTVLTNTAAITTEYIYDARGRRVAKVTAGVTITHYLYDIQYRVLEERDGAGQLLALYTYGAGIDEPLTMERGGNTYYYHRDALGSITELSDAGGAIIERYEYDVYGAVTIYNAGWITRTASAAGNPYLFTGRRFDPESGNYYYRARVYSPALGRFLSMDPLGFEAGDYNLYCYVFGNPATMVDPTGLQVPLLPTPVPQTWLVLHYYKAGEVIVRTETYLYPSFETPRLLVGASVEAGYRHVQRYKPQMSSPWLVLEEEHNEYCAAGDLGLGAPDLGVGVGLELTWLGEDHSLSDVSLGLGAELLLGEVEIEVGTGGLQGMLYYESPGPVATKAGVGLELSSDEHKCYGPRSLISLWPN